MVEQLIKLGTRPILWPGEHASDWDFLATQKAEGLPATLAALPGDLLGTLGHAKDMVPRAFRSVVGNAMAPIESVNPMRPAITREKLQQLMAEGGSGEEKFQAILEKSPVEGALNFGVDVAADPTSWVGGPSSFLARTAKGGLTHTAAISNPALRQGVERTLGMLDDVNGAYDAGQAALLAKGKLGAASVLGHIPAPPGAIITGEFGERTAAPSLGHLLGARSREAQAKLHVRKMADAINILGQKGHRLALDLEDYAPGPSRWPGTTEKATEQIDVYMQGLRKMVADQENPIAKLAGVALWHRADQLTRSAWDQAFLRRQDLMEKFGVDVSDYATAKELKILPIYQQVTQGYKDAFDQSATAIRAAHYLSDTFKREITATPEIPGQAEWYTEVADKALAAIGDTITQFGAQIRNAPAHERAPLIQARNAELDKVVQTALSAIGGPGADVLTTGVGKKLAQRLDQMTNLSMGRPAIVADLPARFTDRRFAEDLFRSVEDLAPGVVKDQNVVRGAVEEMWTNYWKAQGTPPLARAPLDWRGLPVDSATQRLDDVNEVLQQMGMKPVENSVDLIAHMNTVLPDGSPILTDKTRRQATEAIGRWSDADLLQADPYELVLGRLSRQAVRDRFGIEDPNFLKGAIGDATALWKEGQVLTPTYLITNLLGGMMMAGMAGVNPLKIAAPLRDNVLTAIRGETVHNASAKRLAELMGAEIPLGTTSGSSYLHEINATKDYFKKGITASEKVGPGKLATGLGLLGGFAGANAAEDEGEKAKGAVAGAAIGVAGGLAWPKVAKLLLTQVGGALETTMREEAWTTGATTAARKLTPDLMAKFDEVLGRTWRTVEPTGEVPQALATVGGTRIGEVDRSRRAVTTGLSAEQRAAAQADLQSILQAQEGLINANQLQEILIRNGVDIRVARDMGKYWQNSMDEASQEGLKLANHINFDYQDKNTVEELISSVSPFSTWALKAYPFFLEHLMARPGFAVAIRELDELSRERNDEGGLTPRFTGSIEQGLGSQLMSGLLGRGVGTFYNPMRGLLPFADTSRTLQQSEGEGNPIARALNTVGAFGPSLNPFIETALRTAGALGPEEAPRGLLRYGEPIKALTAMAGLGNGQGIDFNLPFTGPERAIRTKLTGEAPTDLTRANILKRLDELALRETGQPTSQRTARTAPYIKAKAEGRGELWDRAAREVQQERGLSSLAGFASQMLAPQAILTDEERAIRLARKEATPTSAGRVVYDPKLANELRELVQAGQQRQPAPAKLLEEAQHDAAQLYGGQVPDVLRQRLERGTVADVDAVRRAVTTAQIQANPLQAGYSGFGSPEEQALSNQLSMYQSPSSLLMTDPELAGASPEALAQAEQLWNIYKGLPPALAQNISQGNMPTALLVKRMLERQRTYKEANPVLSAYLAYQAQTKGTGDMADFFKTYQKA